MKLRQRIALIFTAVVLVALAGCTQPAGTSGPGASTQPAASTVPGYKGDY